MLQFKKRIHKVAIHTLLALVLLQVFIDRAEAATKCHKCTGINCQRTTYAATEDCADALDSCVSVFQGSTVLAQGCLGQLAVELRNKCEMSSVEKTDETEVMDAEGITPTVNKGCHQCRADLCNNVNAEGFDCIQCDSNADAKCASDTDDLQPKRCPISRAMNTHCYAQIEGNRATRGCATDLALQKECSSNSGCSLCSPSDIVGCNRGPKVATDNAGSGGSSSGGGGSGSDSGSGTGNGGSSSGGSDSGSSSGGSGSGSDSGAGSGSDTGNGGSSTGGGNGGSDSGAGSGSSTGNGGSNSGGSSGTGDSGSSSGGSDSGAGSGSSTGNGGSNSGGSSGTGDSGSSSGSSSAGTGSGTGGGDSSSGSGSGSSDNGSSNSGSAAETTSKLLVTVILMILPYFI